VSPEETERALAIRWLRRKADALPEHKKPLLTWVADELERGTHAENYEEPN